MTSNMRVKICGLTRPADVEAAVRGGAAYVGFVFFPKSPRNIDLETARELALAVPPGVGKVALTVDADDAQLDQLLEAVPLDFLQLHGKETPARVSEIKKRAGLAVIKAVGVASADDLPALETYARVADMLLVDAKPPPDATLPGGNGVSFDWRLIANRRWAVPWMLAGGLSPENVAEAIRLTEAPQVDVSSGVESAPGVKDPQLIAEFLQSAGVAARAF